MTHHAPSPGSEDGTITLAHPESGAKRAIIGYPADLDVLVTKIVLEDPRLAASWGDKIYRITLSDTLGAGETARGYPFVVEQAR